MVEKRSERDTREQGSATGREIAVIGMAGRFSGAKNIEEFWHNLKNSVESISFFSSQELTEAGVQPDLLENPGYVPARGILEDKYQFDAPFFGYTPTEAEIMNPEMRIFHECAWEALEDAGYDPELYSGLIGLYAGASFSFHWEALAHLSGKSAEIGRFAASQLTMKEYINSRIAYNLNLKGPTFSVHTACSTSLVAIHLGCRALLTGECQMVLAGGTTVMTEPIQGYMYREGMNLSSDGHCRAFAHKADGMIEGEGAGIVVLKRLKNAIEDGDFIYAVIKGSAINNDGKRKVAFSAPSVEGQAGVIRKALRIAQVEPESIGYIEAHGTGTALGDPVEVEALTLAFNTDKTNFCAIGTVKSNLGHLDVAAGVAGFIKAVLALNFRLIPPSLHFESPNPAIDFEDTPFYVNSRLIEWHPDRYPLRAGVSSFGIGGTNAHVVLEQAPESSGEEQSFNQMHRLLLLSAKTDSALEKMARNLATHLERHPDLNLDRVAYTLQMGRKAFERRKAIACADVDDAIKRLNALSEGDGITRVSQEQRPVVFLFPGQGSQYVNMGLDIYEKEPLFREEMDRCFDLLKPLVDYNIKEILYPGDLSGDVNRAGTLSGEARIFPLQQNVTQGRGVSEPGEVAIDQTEIAQPLIFVIEYALARLLMKWGIKPFAMMGHSIGEYTAACISGVFSLEDALQLVVKRGKLMQGLPNGAMLSVELGQDRLVPLLNSNICLAAVNSPSHCVVSGTHEHIDTFSRQLQEKGYKTRKLHTSHAYHSYMMDPILTEFEKQVKQVRLNEPGIPYISNITGAPVTVSQAVNPGYWSAHLRETVRFGKGIQLLLEEKDPLFIEAGPGNALISFVRYHERKNENERERNARNLNLIRHPREIIPDDCYLLNKLGQLWQQGINIDWQAFNRGEKEKRGRVPLPTYPFERMTYRIEAAPGDLAAGLKLKPGGVSPEKKADISDWFYLPSWKRMMIPLGIGHMNSELTKQSCWLVFSDSGENGPGRQLVKRLQDNRQEVFVVKPGREFSRSGRGEYTINAANHEDYNTLLSELRKGKQVPERIVHFWGCAEYKHKDPELKYNRRIQTLGLYSLMYLAQAIGKQNYTQPLQMAVITGNMQWVTGQEELCPEKATVLGAVNVIPREYRNISCCSIDIIPGDNGDSRETQLADRIIWEFLAEFPGKIIAYRNNSRWVQVMEPMRLEPGPEVPCRLKTNGTYLVTGGLGGIGYTIARHLAQRVQANLVLTGRSEIPHRDQWEQWLATHGDEDKVSETIRKARELEGLGAKLLVCRADAADLRQMQEVIARTETELGPVNGVVHAAGLADGGVIPLRTREKTEQILAPKVTGTLILNHLLGHTPLDFFVNCSSLNSIRGEMGQLGYCAANNFQDAFAYYKSFKDGVFTLSINWDTWAEVGMGAAAVRQLLETGTINDTDARSFLNHAIRNEEGIEVFNRALEYGFPQVVVSTRDIELVIASPDIPGDSQAVAKLTGVPPKKKLYPRPELSTPYTAPGSEFGQQCANILQQFFGFEKVGIHDNLFEYGVTSLEMIRINDQLKKELKKDIPLPVMFEFPTIYTLERFLFQEEAEEMPDNTGQIEQKQALIQNTLSAFRKE